MKKFPYPYIWLDPHCPRDECPKSDTHAAWGTEIDANPWDGPRNCTTCGRPPIRYSHDPDPKKRWIEPPEDYD